MKLCVNEDQRFNPHFPEDYPWNEVDTASAYNLSQKLIPLIRDNLKQPTSHRHLVAGLRKALCVVAETAIIYKD